MEARVSSSLRSVVTASTVVAVLGVLSCSNASPLSGDTCTTAATDSTSQTTTVTATTAAGSLTETTQIATDGAVRRSLTLALHGAPFLSSTIDVTTAGATVDSIQSGHSAHLTSRNGKDWSGTFGGAELEPFHVDRSSDLASLTLRYADGNAVALPASDAQTTAEIDDLIAAYGKTHTQCISVGGVSSPLDAVPPAQDNPSAQRMCTDCFTNCSNAFLGCEFTVTAACLPLVAIPFVGGALAVICFGVGSLVCTLTDAGCNNTCTDGPSCCPVTCGTDSGGQAQCCDAGDRCADPTPGVGTCCPVGHTLLCGTVPNVTCCSDSGDTCLPGPVCCPSGPRVCGSTCCDVGQACVGGVCCTAAETCGQGTSATCCQNGYQCTPEAVGPPQCACGGTSHTCLSANNTEFCCASDQQCAPADSNACCGGGGLGVILCGGHCCDITFGCSTDGQSCGTTCVTGTTCNGVCCSNFSPCDTSTGTAHCCGNPCGPVCCGAMQTCAAPGICVP